MIKKKEGLNDFKIRISKCKNRINKLYDQGFIFSKNINKDLEFIEKKIKQSSVLYKIGGKKILLIAGFLFILSIIIWFIIIPPPPAPIQNPIDELMEINLNNIWNGKVIKDNFTINGTANHSNGDIISVQVRIDGKDWENAVGTLKWNYSLLIDNLSEGEHTLSFRCWDGIKHSNPIKTIIEIQYRIVKPVVVIDNPHDGDNLSGIVSINGTAVAGNGEIQLVKIQFNEEPWENVTGTSSWQRYWDTKEFKNGDYYIKVKCNDSVTNSSISFIFVNVYNPRNITFDPPPIPSGKKFQIYIPPSYEELIKPGTIYEIPGIHCKNSTGFFNFNTYTLLEVSDKPNWLNVSISNQYLITPPDEKIHNLSINISILPDATKNSLNVFTILAYSGKNIFSVYSGIIKTYKTPTILDVYFYTGQW